MEHPVNGAQAEKYGPIDYGVQIRFINDLREPSKSHQTRPKVSKPGSYGVAVRVQGIDGQPFVVLNSGEKGGESFGVQIKGESQRGPAVRHQPLEEALSASPGSTSAFRDPLGSPSTDSELPENPYATQFSPCSGPSDEEPAPQPVPKPDGLDGVRMSGGSGFFLPHGGCRTMTRRKSLGEQQLRRALSQGSLLDPELSDPQEPRGPPQSLTGCTSQPPSTGTLGRSTSTFDLSSPWGPSFKEFGDSSVSGLRSIQKPAPKEAGSSQLAQAAGPMSGHVDTEPLSSVDSLISKFDQKAPPRGRASRRSRISLEGQKRSQSLDGRVCRRDVAADSQDLGGFQEGTQSSTAKPLIPAKPSGSRGAAGKERGFNKAQLTQDWVQQSLEAPGTEKQPRKGQSDLQQKSTPDLLKDQQEVPPPRGSEYTKELIFRLLKEGSSESDASVKRKTNLIYEKIQAFAKAIPPSESTGSGPEAAALRQKVEELQWKLDDQMKLHQRLVLSQKGLRNGLPHGLEVQVEELEEECHRLREAFEKKTQELQRTSQELRDVQATKDQMEDKVAGLGDQLAEMQKEIDRYQEPLSGTLDRDALLKELLESQEDLEEILGAKQKLEEQLYQRERELTALKGALKEEVASHDEELDRVRQQYQQDMQQLRRNVEDVSQDQACLEAERQKVNSLVRSLQTELQESSEEAAHWKEMFQKNKEDLRHAKQELMQVKMEREELEEELKEMRPRLAALRLEVDRIRSSAADPGEASELRKELQEAQELLREKEAQDRILCLQEKEVAALTEKLEDEAARRGQEVEELNQQFLQKTQQLQMDFEAACRVKAALEGEKAASEQTRRAVESTLRDAQEENDDLRRKILGLESQLKECRHIADSWQEVEDRLKEKIFKLEADRKQMEESLANAVDQEQDLLLAKRSLESRLEEAQRTLSKLALEHQQLSSSYQEEVKQKELLKRARSDLEEEKRMLDRSIGKLTKELQQMGEESHQALSELQLQLEDFKEKSRKEISDSHKQAKDRNAEVEKMQFSLGKSQDEVLHLKHALQESQSERENALLDKELLAQRLHSLEEEMESNRRAQADRSRQVKTLEDKSRRLEVELDEERSAVELLTERISRSRDQIDQLRAELLQERSVRQDLECDKVALERQNKDLKNRLASSEGFQKPSASVSQLESRIQDLQDKLVAEEREKSVLLSSNRKLERKVKELNLQIDEERQHVNDQKDQLSLRIKALKRQVDQAEEEIERQEAARKKALRELEEQHEIGEQLQSRIKALEKDLWRKTSRSTAESSLKDDQLSSDEEFDSAYSPSSITSLLTEGNLQTSSC